MELFNYFRSSASYRVRIALALKGLDYDYRSVHLQKNEQLGEVYASVSAARLVPMFRDGEHLVTQSLAIIEYLEEKFPSPPLLPHEPEERAYVRAMALSIACEIHPLNNLRVLRYLKHDLALTEEQKDGWYRHWVERGLAQLEAQLVACRQSGRFVFGDHVTLADVLLVPQIFNARRFNCSLEHVPTVMRIFDACMALPAFEQARPEQQADFV